MPHTFPNNTLTFSPPIAVICSFSHFSLTFVSYQNYSSSTFTTQSQFAEGDFFVPANCGFAFCRMEFPQVAGPQNAGPQSAGAEIALLGFHT